MSIRDDDAPATCKQCGTTSADVTMVRGRMCCQTCGEAFDDAMDEAQASGDMGAVQGVIDTFETGDAARRGQQVHEEIEAALFPGDDLDVLV